MSAVQFGQFVLSYLIAAYRAVFSFFEALLGSVGLYEYVVASILFAIAFGMIIMPFRGQSGLAPFPFAGFSDTVHRRDWEKRVHQDPAPYGHIGPGKEMIWR